MATKRKVTKADMLRAIVFIGCPGDPVDCQRAIGCLRCKAVIRRAIIRLIKESRP